MIDKKFFYAVVGASKNKEKYGYKIFKDLLESGYKVLPINPNEKKILEKEVYPSLSQVKENIDVVIFATQPKITEKILEEAKILWINNAWLQPWSESKKAILFCKENNITCTYNTCIMIQKNKK